MLEGKVSGVQVTSDGQPGADPTVRIRGVGSFGDTSPLYVIDGVPMGTSIRDFSSNDIETIQILKDASAAAIYGSRACLLYTSNSSLSQNFITDIAETGEHTMLVATLKGINLYNALTDNFERINKDTGEGEIVQNTLNCDFVNCLLTDGDIIWVGTEVGGLNKMCIRDRQYAGPPKAQCYRYSGR